MSPPLTFSPSPNQTTLLTPGRGVVADKENPMASAHRVSSVLAHHPIPPREEKESLLPEQVYTASSVLNDKSEVAAPVETLPDRAEEPDCEAQARPTTSQAKGENPSTPLAKRGKTSNRYSHKSKVAAHVGACVLGSITLGILAGPLGAVFALGYVNAMSRAIHGGAAFPVGHQKKTDNVPPTPEAAESDPGENDDKPHANADTFGSNNIIYAPVINIDNSVTLNGNIYFFGDEYHLGAQRNPTASSKWSQTESNAKVNLAGDAARETEAASDNRVDNVSEQVGIATKQQPVELVGVEVTQVQMVSPQVAQMMVHDDTANVFTQSADPLAQVTFSDGMSALLQAPSDFVQQLSQLVDAQQRQEAEPVPTTGPQGTHTWVKQTDGGWLLQPKEQGAGVAFDQRFQQHTSVNMVSHRGEGFGPLAEKSIDASKASATSQYHEGEPAPTLGTQGTHTWVKQTDGGWLLQPKEQGAGVAFDQRFQQHTSVNMVSHRGEGFGPLAEKSIDASKASAISQYHEGEPAPTLGTQGTHTWVKQTDGGWLLQPKEQGAGVAFDQRFQQHTSVNMVSHRGEGFGPLAEKSIDASKASATSQYHEGEPAPTLGTQGTHTWVKQTDGGDAWSLQAKVQDKEEVVSFEQWRLQHASADMASHRGEPFSILVEKSIDASKTSAISQTQEGEPAPGIGNWVKQAEGGWSLQPKEREERVASHHVADTDLTHETSVLPKVPFSSLSSFDEGIEVEEALTDSTTDIPVSRPNPSALWLKTVKDGKVSWSKPSSSADQVVVLSEGSVSGRAKNYNAGPLYNVQPLDELQKVKYAELQGKMKAPSNYVLLGNIPTRPLNRDNFVIIGGKRFKLSYP